MKKYENEIDGQIEFYETFLPRINPELEKEDYIADNTDGVINGNLLEFKLDISNLNSVLFQAIKYLSAMRIKGKKIPANILLVDLNKRKCWKYSSEKYLADIEKVYFGAASKGNDDFVGGKADKEIDWSKDTGIEKIVLLLKETKFTKIHIDENCVVGWAKAYYAKMPTAKKDDFIGDDTGKHKVVGEIREPKVFDDCIYPYEGKTNLKFRYLMDRLNDNLMKKNTGAFYTHELYAKKAVELVRKAIAMVPKGNDYIILDRCAGTGNLEEQLSEEELSHCIVSTIEYYEYKVLLETIGSKVRNIIPPTEKEDTFNAGFVNGADALSEVYINNPIIRKYIDDPKCTVILFENPPYSETTSIEHQKRKAGKESSKPWKNSFVLGEMRKEVKGTALNDLGNAFIWSAFKYYLRQETDSYIVFSPVKYWKAQQLVKRRYGGGYAFNRKFFHTDTPACIMCALWENIVDETTETIELEGFDIEKGELKPLKKLLPVKKVHSIFSDGYYGMTPGDDEKDEKEGIFAEFNGLEASSERSSIRIKPRTNSNIIGYLVVKGANFDTPDSCVHLLRIGAYDANGFYLRKSNYLEKLPMFAASRYITYNRQWTERTRIMKSADGADKFFKDVKAKKLDQFLLKCLLFTCIEMQNHCRSFKGSDKRLYKNELCLDKGTLALKALENLKRTELENKIFEQWKKVLSEAKKTGKMMPGFAYGIYQIYDELNTYDTVKIKGKTKNIYHYVELNSALAGMKALCREYYSKEIVPTLFKYEFLK